MNAKLVGDSSDSSSAVITPRFLASLEMTGFGWERFSMTMRLCAKRRLRGRNHSALLR